VAAKGRIYIGVPFLRVILFGGYRIVRFVHIVYNNVVTICFFFVFCVRKGVRNEDIYIESKTVRYCKRVLLARAHIASVKVPALRSKGPVRSTHPFVASPQGFVLLFTSPSQFTAQ